MASGDGPRQLINPHGIGICSGNLFVCDTGNHRLSVFALHGFVLRGHWQPPAAAYQAPNPVLHNTWEPFDLAFDRYGKVYVTDGANGAVHVFSASGQWQKCFSGIGSVTWIATDCGNNVFVVVTGPPDTVRRLNLDGSTVLVESSPGRIGITVSQHCHFQLMRKVSCTSAHFARRHLGRGAPPTFFNQVSSQQPQERGLFDLRGNAVNRCSAPIDASYLTSGTYISIALDSELYRCQWHRVILRGDIPAGSQCCCLHTYSRSDAYRRADPEFE